MPFKFLTLEVADRVATLTVNRPDKLNALNDATIAALGNAIDHLPVYYSIGRGIHTGPRPPLPAGPVRRELFRFAGVS